MALYVYTLRISSNKQLNISRDYRIYFIKEYKYMY